MNFVTLFSKTQRNTIYRHSLEIFGLKLSPESKDNEQVIVFNDANQDLYSLLMRNENTFQIFKLSSMIDDFIWHSQYNVLVALNDNQALTLWLYPHVAYVDANLLQDVQLQINVDSPAPATASSTTSSKNSKLIEFTDNQIMIIKSDNIRVHTTVNPFVTLLHKLQSDNRWNDAVKMCNIIHEFNNKDSKNDDKLLCNALWATLAVMALEAKQFDTAEIAYAAIDRIEKVMHLNEIKAIPQADVQTLELELMRCNIDAAEMGFIQKGYFLRAVYLNLTLYRWMKAIKLASQFNQKFKSFTFNNRDISLMEIVLSNRQYFLQLKSKNETIQEYLEALKNYEDLPEWKQIESAIKNILYEK